VVCGQCERCSWPLPSHLSRTDSSLATNAFVVWLARSNCGRRKMFQLFSIAISRAPTSRSGGDAAVDVVNDDNLDGGDICGKLRRDAIITVTRSSE